jgi:hypothetical protein
MSRTSRAGDGERVETPADRDPYAVGQPGVQPGEIQRVEPPGDAEAVQDLFQVERVAVARLVQLGDDVVPWTDLDARGDEQLDLVLARDRGAGCGRPTRVSPVSASGIRRISRSR